MSEFWIWERGQGYTEDSEENHLKTWVRKFWYVLYQQVSNYIHLSLDYRKTLQWVRGRIVLRKPICRSSVYIGIPKIDLPKIGSAFHCFPFLFTVPFTHFRKERQGSCHPIELVRHPAWLKSSKTGSVREGKATGTITFLKRNQCSTKCLYTATASQLILSQKTLHNLPFCT